MDYPIRVLCVFSTLDRGGAESMCMNIYRKIDRSKVQFDFVKHTSDIGAYEDEIIDLGGRVYEAPTYKLINHFSYCAWWENHFKNHTEHTIIHGHYFTIASVYFRIAKKYNRITIAHSHAKAVDSKIKELMIRFLPEVSDYKLACSNEAGKWLYRGDSFVVLKNAIDLESYRFNPEIRNTYRENLGIDNKYVVGTVANFSKVKNPFGLIDLFDQVHKKCKRACLLWVGDGGLRGEIEKRIDEKGLSNHVILLGTRSDVPQLLQAMDVFVLPSLSEGLGIAAIEAQAAGLPTICSSNVPKEAAISPLCSHLALNNLGIWVDTVLAQDVYKRDDSSNYIAESGYDVSRTSKWIENFYCDIISNKLQ